MAPGAFTGARAARDSPPGDEAGTDHADVKIARKTKRSNTEAGRPHIPTYGSTVMVNIKETFATAVLSALTKAGEERLTKPYGKCLMTC